MPLLRVLTTERLVFAIFLVILTGFVSAYNADTFLHLAAGRYIVETGSLPHRDVFSFSAEGRPWIMHEWLYQAAIFLAYEVAGMAGLKLLTGLACIATLYLAKKSADLLTGSWVKWLVLGLLLILLQRFISPRPVLVTMVLFSFYLYALLAYRYGNGRRLLYGLPPLMILWVNSHGGFIVGLVLIAYFTLLQMIGERYCKGTWVLPRLPLLILLLCLVASLLNPYGYEQLLFPFRLMSDWAVGMALEWRPPDFAQWHNRVFLGAVLLFAFVAAVTKGKDRFFSVALVLPFVLAAFSAVRHVLLASLVLAPYLSLLLGAAAEQGRVVFRRFMPRLSPVRQENRQPELGEREFVLNGMVLLVMVLMLYLAYPAHRSGVAAQEEALYPVAATRYLQHNGIEGRLFSPMDYSDYILFSLYPRIKIFYDVRLEIYGEQLAREYIRMMNVEEGWRELFHRYAIDVVVTKTTGKLFSALSDDAVYGKVYQDQTNAVFLRNGVPSAALATQH
jgi:hypothetical protein